MRLAVLNNILRQRKVASASFSSPPPPLVFRWSAIDSAMFQDVAKTLPATLQNHVIKAINGVAGTTPSLEWQSGNTGTFLPGGRSGGRTFYLDSAQLKVLGSPTLWDPANSWAMGFTMTPREDVGGSIKQWFSKASASTGPWIFRQQTHRPEFLGKTGNVPPSVWDMIPVVPRGPQVVVFEWDAPNNKFNIYLNNLLAASLNGPLPALDVVNDMYLGGNLGGNQCTTGFNDVSYWSGKMGLGNVQQHTTLMMKAHFLVQNYIVAWGDSLTDDTRANWINSLFTNLTLAGIHRPIINCGLGGQCLSNRVLSAGNSMAIQYPNREKKLLPDAYMNSIFMGFEWVNEADVILQEIGWVANHSIPYDANAVADEVIEKHRLVVQQAKNDGFKICICFNMYDCVPTYVPLDVKHAINSKLAALFPTAHPRVANVSLPTGATYYGDYLVDWASAANIGPDGSYSNTTYFTVDGIHEGPGAAAIKVVAPQALIIDFTNNPPAAFSIPDKQTAADTTSNLLFKFPFNGNSNDSSGNGNNLTTNGTVTYQAGLVDQEAILTPGNVSYFSHADAAIWRFNRAGQLGWECCAQIKADAFTGIPFWAQKANEWELRGGLNGGNGDLSLRLFDSVSLGTEIVRVALPAGTIVTTKPQFLAWGVDLVNKIAYICIDNAISYLTYTATPHVGTANAITFGGSGSAAQYTTAKWGELRGYTAAPLLNTAAGFDAALARWLKIRREMGLPAL